MTEEELVKMLRTTSPSCLKGFNNAPAELPEPFDDNPTSVWRISCTCGGKKGRFLGYSLKDYNSKYDGPELFISPLTFECGACKKTTELLDTDRHGYHADVARRDGGLGSAKLRGKGAQQPFVCPGCRGDMFEVTVAFVFWSPDELVEFEDNWADLFNVFLCYCNCVVCGQTSMPTDFGKL